MLSRALLDQTNGVSHTPEKATGSLIRIKPQRSPSISSDEEPVYSSNTFGEVQERTTPGDDGDNMKTKRLVIASPNGRGVRHKSEVSRVISIVSRSTLNPTLINFLYDTDAIWRKDGINLSDTDLSVKLDEHVHACLLQSSRIIGAVIPRGVSSTDIDDLFKITTNERLRRMLPQGSQLDRVFKRAETFAKRFSSFLSALSSNGISITEGLGSIVVCYQALVKSIESSPIFTEQHFATLEQASAILARIAERIDKELLSTKIRLTVKTVLALVLDNVTVALAAIKGQQINTINKLSNARPDPRSDVLIKRLRQLDAEFQLELLRQCLEIQGSRERLFSLVNGFDIGLEACPPAYVRGMMDVCQAFSAYGETDSAPKMQKLLWASFRQYRQDCEVSLEEWLDLFEQCTTGIGAHFDRDEMLLLIRKLREIAQTELNPHHPLYLRVSIELAKLLETDDLLYTEAVAIYEDICGLEPQSYASDETLLDLLETARYRLTVLFELHADLAPRAEKVLLDTFSALIVQFSYTDDKVLASLTRIIEYYRKLERKDDGARILERYIKGLLIEERNELVLFKFAIETNSLYRSLSAVDLGLKFLTTLKSELAASEFEADTDRVFTREQQYGLDRRCFVLISALEQLLCGYSEDGLLDKIVRDLCTESCLFEAWYRHSHRSSQGIHARLAAGARLVAFLDKRDRKAEIRVVRKDMWEGFRSTFAFTTSTALESLWELFEASISNSTDAAGSIAMLETLVNVSLDLYRKDELEATLDLLRWAHNLFKQFVITHRARVTDLALKLSDALAASTSHDDGLKGEIGRLTSDIVLSVLTIGTKEVWLSNIPTGQLNTIIGILGRQKNFSMLEFILQYVWDTRMDQGWTWEATVAIGKRLSEVHFAAGHAGRATELLESICYNLRDVLGRFHVLTVECENLRASFHNTNGQHAAAREIHERLLQELATVQTGQVEDTSNIAEVVMDQAKRLKYACHLGGGEGLRRDRSYATLFENTKSSVVTAMGVDTVALAQALDFRGPEQETVWQMPQDWSLPSVFR